MQSLSLAVLLLLAISTSQTHATTLRGRQLTQQAGSGPLPTGSGPVAAAPGSNSAAPDGVAAAAAGAPVAANPSPDAAPVQPPSSQPTQQSAGGDAKEYIVIFKTVTAGQAAIASLQSSVAAAVPKAAASGDAATAAAGSSSSSAFTVVSKVPQTTPDHQDVAAAAAASDQLHAMVISVAADQADAVVQGLEDADAVASVLPNFATTLHQAVPSACAPPAALSGLAAAKATDLTWSYSQRSCAVADNKVVWYGERCGDDMSRIRWVGLYTVDAATGNLMPMCTRLRSTSNYQLNMQLFGGCGSAPNVAPNLPTRVCIATSGASSLGSSSGCLTPVAAGAGAVVSATATLDTVFNCTGASTNTVTLTGVPCGPNGKFVQWNAARPQGCSIIRRSLVNNYRNADWLGQCGVPAARMRTISIDACPQSVDNKDNNPNPPPPPPTPTRMGRVKVVTGDSLSTGVQRIEAAQPNSNENSQQAQVPDITTGAAKAAVVVMDTGVAMHPDLNVMGGYSTIAGKTNPNEDLVGHGTHVAGIIAAKNGGGYTVGVAPGAPVYSVRVMTGQAGGGGDLFAGLYWVRDNAKALGIRVINLSLGARFGSRDQMLPYCAVFDEVTAQGVTVVVSAGNDAMDLSVQFPAGCPQVIVTTAMVDLDGVPSADDKPGEWSNYLPGNAAAADKARTVAAPGWDILSTVPFTVDPSGTGRKSGTSQASPFVAGVALNCYLWGSCSSSSSHENAKVAAAAAARYSVGAPGSYGFPGDAQSAPGAAKYYGYLIAGATW